MLQNYNKYALLKVFFVSPTESFRLRELARLSGISPPSVMNYLSQFLKEGLIEKYQKRGVPFYRSQRENEKFILYKKIALIFELNDCGLVSYLWEKLSPEAIVLFGSAARGESIESSDIDICIVGREARVNINKYEKSLNSSVHLIFEQDSRIVSPEFKNNLANGIVLKGYLRLL